MTDRLTEIKARHAEPNCMISKDRARSDIAWLIAELERERETRERYEKALKEIEQMDGERNGRGFQIYSLGHASNAAMYALEPHRNPFK